MDMIGKVRRMKLRDQLSLSEIAKRTGLSRNTVKKWLKAPGDTNSKLLVAFCTQLNTIAIMIWRSNLYLKALSNGLYTAPDIQAFLMVWNFYNKNHRCEECQT